MNSAPCSGNIAGRDVPVAPHRAMPRVSIRQDVDGYNGSSYRRSKMPLLALPAVFMRGGTSRAIMFHRKDLPEQSAWDPIFLAAMGSPDPNGRQLNGMGGGISSLSKICILAPSEREDADIDYTFAQVQIRDSAVDYRGNCGNMSSAVGPFAVDEAIVRPNGDTAVVRIFNSNTKKLIRATFPLRDGSAATDGDLA